LGKKRGNEYLFKNESSKGTTKEHLPWNTVTRTDKENKSIFMIHISDSLASKTSSP
jgi:hypothetical protein